MPRIPGYERQVSAGAAEQLNLPRYDARDFGGQVGVGLQQVGAAFGERAQRLEVESENAARMDGARRYAEAQAAANKARAARRQSAAADGAGHVEGVLQDFDAIAAKSLEGVTNPRVRARLETDFIQLRSSIDLDEDGYATGLRSAKTASDTQSAIEIEANSLYTAGTPEQLATALGRWQANLQGMQLQPEVRSKLESYAKNRLSRSFVEGLAERDPYQARELLRSGALNSFIDADNMTGIGNRVDAEIRGREAQARMLEAQRRAEQRAAEAEARRAAADARRAVLDQARDVQDGLRAGVIYSPEEIAGIAGAAARLPGGAALARNIATLGTQAQVAVALRGASPRQVQDTVNALAAEKAKGGQSAVQASAQLEAALAVQAAQERGLKTDPLSYAVTQGLVQLAPLNPTDPNSVRQRAQAARQVKARYGGPLTLLTDEEAAEYAGRLRSGDANQRWQTLKEIQAMGPTGAAAAMRQIGGSRPVEARAGALLATAGGARTAKTILDGMDAIKADARVAPKADAYPLARTEIGRAFRFLPELETQIPDAARAFYAGWKQQVGEDGFDDENFRQAVNAAAGGVRGSDGVMRGGLGKRAGHTVLLPDGKTEDEFNGALDRLTLDGLPAAKRPIGPSGRPWTAEQLRKARPFAIGGGRYRLATDAAGQDIVMTAEGRPFEIVVR